MWRSILLMLLITGLTPSVSGQAIKDLTRADSLRMDFSVFRKALQDNCPSLYRYTDSLTLNRKFDSCFASISAQSTALDFLRITRVLLSAVRDGHLYGGPAPGLRQYLDEQVRFFPLRLHFAGDKAYILKSGDSSLPAGTEIVAINNQPVNVIKEELFKYIVADGAITSKKYHILNHTFFFYYLLAYGERPSFSVTSRLANAHVKTTRVNAVFAKDISRFEDDQPGHLLNLSFHDDIAVLTIRSFAADELKTAHEDFPAFLERSFKAISDRQIKKLIIDLRGNGGGRDLYGSLLYAYLTDRPFHYYRSLTAVTKDLPYNAFKSPASSYNDLNISMLEPAGARTYRLKKMAHPNLQPVQPARHNFKGTVWCLINGLCFSTTAEFCAIARSNHRGKFVGEETGGAYHGNASGAQMEIILPYTKTIVSIPLIKYEMAVNNTKHSNRGIIPDYPILLGTDDIIHKRDVQLSYALELAGKKL